MAVIGSLTDEEENPPGTSRQPNYATTPDIVPPPPPPPPDNWVKNAQGIYENAPPPPPPPPSDWTKNAQGVWEAPKAPPTIGGSASSQVPDPVYALPPTMPTYEKPQGVAPVVAAQAPGVSIGGANTVGNTPIADPTHANATLAAYTKINGQDQGQIRNDQVGFLNALQAQAAGTSGPSAAELLYKRAADQAIGDQLSTAAMTHGYGAGAAALAANKNIGKLQGDAALGAAQVRAEEQQKAQQLYGQQLGQTREADQKMSIAQASFDQATNELNAHLATDVSLRNADFDNETARLKAQLDQATAFRNAAADEQLRVKQGELDLSNNQFNTGETNKTTQFNSQQEQQRNLLDAQLKNTFGLTLAELEAKVNQFNASQGQQNTQYYAGLNNQRDLAQLSATLQAMGYNNDQIRTFMNGYMGSSGNVAGADAANRAADDKFFWDIVNMGGNALAPGVGGAAANAVKTGVGGDSNGAGDSLMTAHF